MINNENNSRFSVDYNEKVLEVKNLKKYFHVGVGRNKLTIPAVDDISFDVYKREVFGLVGESGCGKTTAARTIIKIYNATEGTVDLSGIRIGLGVDGFKNQIKMLKEAANEKISILDPKKSAKFNLTKKYEHDILLANHEINSLIAEKKQQIKLVHDEINTANDVKYNLKNQEVIAIESAIYNYELGVNKIKREVKNEALEEYNNEVKMAEISFERKSEGLKESAALEKETILKRLEALTLEYKEQLEVLKNKFEPLIEAGKATMLPKEEAKKMLAELKEQKKANVHKIKLEFSEKRAALVGIDLEAIKEKKAAVKAKYDDLIAKQKQNIKDLKLKYKEDIKNIKIEPLSEEEEEKINKKIEAINSEISLKVNEIRNKIIEGRNVNNSKETHEAAQRMQMIFQDPISSLNPRMTVKEIVSEGLAIRGGYTSEELDQKVAEVLEIVGLLPEYAARYPHEFSGGQRQRIGIARALIMNPDFIIADEPISALDVSIRAQVLNLLSDLKEKLGLTILFIAHDLSVVRFFCDRIAVMYYGKIVEVATAEELFANPMHPYTISLLSAVPQPDPDYEKGRKRIHYNPRQHDYIINKPSLQEIAPGHLVYANDDEFKVMKEKYELTNGKEGGDTK